VIEKKKHAKVKSQKSKDGMWTLKCDGSKSKQGAGVGVELIDPQGKSYLAAYRLQFSCTNNIVEYKALILGLVMAIKKRVK